MSTPSTIPPTGNPTQSSLDDLIKKILLDNHLSVTEFEDIILEMQKDGIMDKDELAKLATLKTKANADNPNQSARINAAYISAIPIEEANKMVKNEAKKWIIIVIFLFAGWLMSYLVKMLPTP